MATIVIGYAVLSYYSESTPDALGLAAGLSLAPIVLIGAVLVWRWTAAPVAASIIVLAGGLLYHYWAFFRDNYPWSNFAQQFGAYALVALGFLRSLSAGRVPMCTQLAEKLHGPLTPEEISYTRRATVAWAVFYALLTAAIAILFFTVPLRVWSMFVNFATFALMGLMFVVEHAVRRRVIPHRRGGMLTALRQLFLGG